MRVPALKVDDGDSIRLAQCHISLTVIGYSNIIRSGAECTAFDRNAEIDGAHDRIGLEVYDGQAVAIGVCYVQIGSVDRHAGWVQTNRDRFHLFALREVHNRHSAGEGKTVISVHNDRRTVGSVRKVPIGSWAPAFVADIGILAVDDNVIRNISNGKLGDQFRRRRCEVNYAERVDRVEHDIRAFAVFGDGNTSWVDGLRAEIGPTIYRRLGQDHSLVIRQKTIVPAYGCDDNVAVALCFGKSNRSILAEE